MTREEFQAWKEETEKSVNDWRQDFAALRSRGEIMLYKGGVSGVYIWIERDGRASIGTYDGAVPHIGEAFFSEDHFRKFDSFDDAFKIVFERLGLGVLISSIAR